MKEIKTMLLGIAFMIQAIFFILLFEWSYISLIIEITGLILVFIGYGKETDTN